MSDRVEFRCETCGKLLRAPVSKAGAASECPQCGDVVRVPTDGGLLGTFTPPDVVVCPVCGTEADAADAACPACGELLGGMGVDEDGRPAAGPTEVTLGSVWAAAWETWKEQLGMLLAGWLLAGLILTSVGVAGYVGMIAVFVAAAVAGGGGGGGGPSETMLVVGGVGAFLLFVLACLAGYAWMILGLTGMHLEAVRSRPELGTLFRASGFWKALLCGSILWFCGTVLGVVPMIGVGFGLEAAGGAGGAEGFVFLLMYGVLFAVLGVLFLLFWPVPFLCHDRPDVGHVKPLWRALTLPEGRWGGHLAVGAAAYGLLLAGSFVCYVGLLFTGPLAGLLLAHAYDRYDRSSADDRPRALDPEGTF